MTNENETKWQAGQSFSYQTSKGEWVDVKAVSSSAQIYVRDSQRKFWIDISRLRPPPPAPERVTTRIYRVVYREVDDSGNVMTRKGAWRFTPTEAERDKPYSADWVETEGRSAPVFDGVATPPTEKPLRPRVVAKLKCLRNELQQARESRDNWKRKAERDAALADSAKWQQEWQEAHNDARDARADAVDLRAELAALREKALEPLEEEAVEELLDNYPLKQEGETWSVFNLKQARAICATFGVPAPARRKCEDCNGTGRRDVEPSGGGTCMCLACAGSGVIPPIYAEPPAYPASKSASRSTTDAVQRCIYGVLCRGSLRYNYTADAQALTAALSSAGFLAPGGPLLDAGELRARISELEKQSADLLACNKRQQVNVAWSMAEVERLRAKLPTAEEREAIAALSVNGPVSTQVARAYLARTATEEAPE
jgi:hypothetical protein